MSRFLQSGATRVQRRIPELADLCVPDFNPAGYARPSAGEPGSLLEYWRILTKRKGTLMLVAIASLMSGYFFTKLQAPVYRARTLVQIESINDHFLNMRDANQSSSDATTESPEYNIRTQVTVLQSRPVIERTLDKLNLRNRILKDLKKRNGLFSPGSKAPHSAAATRAEITALASNSLRIRSQPNTHVLEITFDAKDPQIAADFANSLTSAFTEVTLENRLKITQDTSIWLTRQIQDVKAKLERSQLALQEYAHRANLTFTSQTETDTTAQERMKEMELELSRAEGDRIEKQARYELARQAPADSLPEVIDNGTLREYQVQLTQLRRELADLLSRFTPDYPKAVSTQAQIKSLQSALEKGRANILERTRNEYESAVRRETLLKTTNSELNGLMLSQADKLNHYSLLKQELDTSQKLYDAMTKRVKEADLDSAMRASNIQVIEAAQAPGRAYKPVLSLDMAFGLVSGLGLGCLVLIQRARANTRIQEPGEIALELNVPELGIIPAGDLKASPRFRLLPKKSAEVANGGKPELCTLQNAPSALAESFRLILASIHLWSQSSGPMVIAFSSAQAGEGKSTVVSNLAIALSRMNRRVLLIDGDLRKRRLHRIFGLNNTTGLKEALLAASSAQSRESEPVQVIKVPDIPNLFLLPSGKGETGEMIFFTNQLRALLQRLKTQFDMILVDTPPLLQVADARLICHEADSCVLVVAQHTPRELVILANEKLSADGSRLLGTVLNKYDPKTSLHAYERYGNYYSDYYGKPSVEDTKNE